MCVGTKKTKKIWGGREFELINFKENGKIRMSEALEE